MLLAACTPGGGFDGRLAEYQRQSDTAATLARQCAGELRSLAVQHPADTDRALTSISSVQSALRGPAQAWLELAVNEKELEGALATLSHATTDGAVALERVVSAATRVHGFQVTVCEARDVAFTLAKIARPRTTAVIAEGEGRGRE
ncbi:MAG TPA: hypothetical protein VF805_10850 [Anaeromyxobacteraceae bacterium]